MEEKEVLVTDNVTEKKKMNPTKKKITIAGVIVGIIAVIAILIGVNHTAIMSDITYSFMPKSITPDFSGTKVEFYKYKNKDYNQFKDENKPLKAFGFYYIDENGKKQDLSWDGVYIAPDGTKFTPNIWFMIKAQEKLTTFKRTASKVIPVVVIVVIVALIYLWFRLWCNREDKRMEAPYGNNEQKKLANNKKKKKK